LLKYIKKYNLTKKIVKIPSSWDFIDTNKQHIDTQFSNVTELIDYLVNKFKNSIGKTKKYLMSKNLYNVCIDTLGQSEANYLEARHPYYSEIFIMNAYDSLISFKNDLDEKMQFYCLDGGLSQITKNMYNECLTNGCKFKFGTKFNKSKYDDNLQLFVNVLTDPDNHKFTINSNNLILAIDGKSFKKINLSNFDKYLTQNKIKFKDLQKSINVQPLLRTYAKYRTNSWVTGLNKTVTNDKIKFIIPISQNLVMISYTDGKYAKYWYKKIIDQTQEDELDKSIATLFPDKNVSDSPVFIKNYYWEQGASYWTTNIDSSKYIELISKPTKLNLYICGDSFSNRQAWIEGALESSNKVFDQIKLN
jgi:hypothetical protein